MRRLAVVFSLLLCQLCVPAQSKLCSIKCEDVFVSCEKSCLGSDSRGDPCKCQQNRKSCLRSCETRAIADPHGGTSVEVTLNKTGQFVDVQHDRKDTAKEPNDDKTIIYIVIGVVGGVILLLAVALVAALCIRSKRRRRRRHHHPGYQPQLGPAPVYPAPPAGTAAAPPAPTVSKPPEGCPTCASKGKACAKCVKASQKDKKLSSMSPTATKYTTDK